MSPPVKNKAPQNDHINNLKKKIFIKVKIAPTKELTYKREEVLHL